MSPRARSPVPELSDGNGSGERAAYGTRYKVAGGHSQRSPWSTCGSSSVADGLDDLCDELTNLSRIDRQRVSEFDDGSEGDNEENQKLRVCIAGHFGVGKTALVSQFMSSEYMNTYEKSLGKYCQWLKPQCGKDCSIMFYGLYIHKLILLYLLLYGR